MDVSSTVHFGELIILVVNENIVFWQYFDSSLSDCNRCASQFDHSSLRRVEGFQRGESKEPVGNTHPKDLGVLLRSVYGSRVSWVWNENDVCKVKCTILSLMANYCL